MGTPFDRSRIRFRPLAERQSKFRIEDIAVDPDGPVPEAGRAAGALEAIAAGVAAARRRGAPVVICHGAHLIKNGLGPLLIRLVREGWLTHVATNGAGSIHDWEFAHLGRSTEDVKAYVAVGEFGLWEETGRYLALALAAGACEGLGYGEAVGRMIATESLVLPEPEALRALVAGALAEREPCERGAAALDLLGVLAAGGGPSGRISIPHPWKARSVQAACWEAGVPFTVHPGIGQDIVYSHPLLHGGPVGRGAMHDFLVYAGAIARLEGGVYLSVGSSVMSPMIFEKSLSMARNVLRQAGGGLTDFLIAANDLADVDWDWSRGEPPVENPAYYVRFLKSFSRMGGRFLYAGMDNRAFLLNLYARLRGTRVAPRGD
jgi:hypothetical protein